MLKKTITYTNFNDEEETEVFFFNLSKAELIELEMTHEGGLSDSLKKIAASEDGAAIIREMKNLILTSYGKKSPDGRRFIKNQQIRDEFESSEAYSALFMELVTDADAAVAFVQGIVPAGMTVDAEESSETNGGVRQFDKATMTMKEAPTEYPQHLDRATIERMSSEEVANLGELIRTGKVVIDA